VIDRLRQIANSLMVVMLLVFTAYFGYLCLTSPVNPDIALEYKTLLANELSAGLPQGDSK